MSKAGQQANEDLEDHRSKIFQLAKHAVREIAPILEKLREQAKQERLSPHDAELTVIRWLQMRLRRPQEQPKKPPTTPQGERTQGGEQGEP